MNHHIESGFNRTLEPWAGESIVGNAQDFLLARDLGDGLDVDQLQQRVARCFDPNHARIRLDRFLQAGGIGQIDKGEIQISRTTTHLLEQPESTPVQVVTDYEVRAALQGIKRRCHGGEPGGKSPSACAALEIGNATFIGQSRWIDGTRIIITLVFPRTFLHVGRGRIDWRHDRAGRRVRLLSGVNDARSEIVRLFHMESFKKPGKIIKPKENSCFPAFLRYF